MNALRLTPAHPARKHRPRACAKPRSRLVGAGRVPRQTGVPFVTTFHGIYGEANARSASTIR